MVGLSSLGSINKGAMFIPFGAPLSKRPFPPPCQPEEIDIVCLGTKSVPLSQGLTQLWGCGYDRERCTSNGPFQEVNSLSLQRIR